MNKLLFLLLFFSLVLSSTAQRYKSGVFVAGGIARMTLSENKLNDEVFVRQGNPFPTFSLGLMGYVTKSRDQPSRWFNTSKGVLLEGSLCRCGGNIQVTTTLPTGDKTFDELKYIQYQLNISPKLMLGVGNVQFLLGPNISANLYSGVEVVKDNVIKSAKSQFNPIAVGLEGGVGVDFGEFLFSTRYRGYITSYGQETTLIPTEFGNAQLLFVLSWFYIDRNIEKNRGSIFWD